MAKLCTSVEQSRRLVELGLDTNTADMYWIRHWGKEIPRSIQEGYEGKTLSKAWSLAALLGVLPEIQGGKPIIALDDNYITYPHISDLHTKADNLVDACVAMIEKLHELKML